MRDVQPNRPMIEPLEQRRLLSVQQFADLAPAGLNPSDLTPFKNELLFLCNSPNGNDHLQLWVSDGTAKGTKMLKDVGPEESDYSFANGTSSYKNGNLTVSGNYAYFVEHADLNVAELWRTDGTAGGTVLIRQFDQNDELQSLIDYQGELMFADKGTLWKSDGTRDGTVSVAQVGGTDPFTWPSSPVVAGDWLYFSGGSGDTAGLWRTDGTSQGTSWCTTALGSSEAAVGDNLYFTLSPSSGVTELWRSDPVSGMVKVGSFSSISSLTNINSQAWFIAKDQWFTQQSIWWTDGTTLHRAYTPSTSTTLADLTGAGNNVLFVSETRESSPGLYFGPPPLAVELLSLDTANDNSVQDLGSLGTTDENGFVNSLKVGNQAVYVVLAQVSYLSYLYKSDGTPAGTAQFGTEDIDSSLFDGLSISSNSHRIPPVINGRFFFSALDKMGEFRLWSSDLTSAGTHIVYEKQGISGGYSFSNLLTVGGALYFATFGSGQNPPVCVWKTDGVHQPSLIRMFDITTGGDPTLFSIGQTMAVVMNGDLWTLSSRGKLVQITGNLNLNDFSLLSQTSTRDYFTASQGGDVYLWTTDGTAKGTVRLYAKKLHANTVTQYFDPTQFQNRLYFILQPAGSSERQLWRTDGTTLGTVRVTSFGTFSNPNPVDIGTLGKWLSYVVPGLHGTGHLWLSDGTKSGTALLADVAAQDMTTVGATLFFWAHNIAGQPVLYKSDGTKHGTVRVKTFGNGDLQSFQAVGGRLYFQFNTANEWVSDGTPAGTVPTAWPQDATPSFLGNSIFLTDSAGIYRGDKGHAHLIATLPTDADPGAVAQLGDRYFFPLSYADPETGDSKEGLWFYQQ